LTQKQLDNKSLQEITCKGNHLMIKLSNKSSPTWT